MRWTKCTRRRPWLLLRSECLRWRSAETTRSTGRWMLNTSQVGAHRGAERIQTFRRSDAHGIVGVPRTGLRLRGRLRGRPVRILLWRRIPLLRWRRLRLLWCTPTWRRRVATLSGWRPVGILRLLRLLPRWRPVPSLLLWGRLLLLRRTPTRRGRSRWLRTGKRSGMRNARSGQGSAARSAEFARGLIRNAAARARDHLHRPPKGRKNSGRCRPVSKRGQHTRSVPDRIVRRRIRGFLYFRGRGPAADSNRRLKRLFRRGCERPCQPRT